MIYICGHNFAIPPTSRDFNITGMEPGSVYQIRYIQKIQDTQKFRYTFVRSGDPTSVVKDFQTTREADMFIARVSGKTEDLRSQMQKIQLALDSDDR